MNQIQSVRDLSNQDLQIDSQYVKKCKFDHINIADGTAAYQLDADNQYYYEMLSNMTGETINGEYQLMQLLMTLAEMKKEYSKVLSALESVRQKVMVS